MNYEITQEGRSLLRQNARQPIGKGLLEGSTFIGCGADRDVYHHVRLGIVFKLSTNPKQNVMEFEMYRKLPDTLKPYFAECIHLSDDGLVLIQKYYAPFICVTDKIKPDTLVPVILTKMNDLKIGNFGASRHKRRIIPVMVDYGLGVCKQYDDGLVYSDMIPWEEANKMFWT